MYQRIILLIKKALFDLCQKQNILLAENVKKVMLERNTVIAVFQSNVFFFFFY